MRPDLIVIDTLSASFVGEEETLTGMNGILQRVHALKAHGAAVILVHHSPKAATKANATPRGGGNLNGTLELSIYVEEADKQLSTSSATFLKNKNGQSGWEVLFQGDVLSLGCDDEGDDITAPVFGHIDDGLRADARVRKLSGQAFKAWRIIGGMVSSSRLLLDDETHPEENTCILLRHEVEEALQAAGALSDSEDASSRKKAAGRALEKLAKEELVSLGPDSVSVNNSETNGVTG